MKILIVDHPSYTEFYKAAFVDSEYEVEYMEDGRGIIDRIRNNQYDLIVIEIMLPFKNGLEILENIKESDLSDNKVLIVSNLNHETIVSNAMELGAVGFVDKSEVDIYGFVDLCKKYAKKSQTNQKKEGNCSNINTGLLFKLRMFVLGIFIRSKSKKNAPLVNSRISEITDFLRTSSLEDRAYFFIDSVWTLAGLQIENHITLPDGTPYRSARITFGISNSLLHLLQMLEKESNNMKALEIEFWYWNSYGRIDHNIRESLNNLWMIIEETRSLWIEKNDQMYKEYSNEFSSGALDEVKKLAEEILANSPPDFILSKK